MSGVLAKTVRSAMVNKVLPEVDAMMLNAGMQS
jgi:hypothetical protein